MKMPRGLGMILLGGWLILTGLLRFVSVPIPFLIPGMAILAIVAGVLILIGR